MKIIFHNPSARPITTSSGDGRSCVTMFPGESVPLARELWVGAIQGGADPIAFPDALPVDPEDRSTLPGFNPANPAQVKELSDIIEALEREGHILDNFSVTGTPKQDKLREHKLRFYIDYDQLRKFMSKHFHSTVRAAINESRKRRKHGKNS